MIPSLLAAVGQRAGLLNPEKGKWGVPGFRRAVGSGLVGPSGRGMVEYSQDGKVGKVSKRRRKNWQSIAFLCRGTQTRD